MKLTSVEVLGSYKFTIEHNNCSDKYGSNNIFKLKSIPSTGLGCGISIKCGFCKETKDITDYEAW